MADIVFAPICSNCGLPIYMDINVEDLDYINSVALSHESKILHHIQISPSICPNCGEHFVLVKMPTRLPYEFPNDVKKLNVQPYNPYNIIFVKKKHSL